MKPIKVLLADDHRIIREGLTHLISDVKGIDVMGEAGNGKEVMNFMNNHKRVDLVLMDVNMPVMNGIDTTQMLSKKYPKTKVLGLSFYNDERYITKMIEAGAKGYILKSTGKDELISAIKTLYRGQLYFSPEVSGIILDKQARQEKTNDLSADDIRNLLTEREIEILGMIAGEMTNTDIADKLGLSHRTVDTHRGNILKKLGVKNTAGLVRAAIKAGFID